MMSLAERYEQLLEVVSRSRGAVAFSGGVDSSLVLKAAVDVFGAATIAFFADSVLQPPGELENARKIADLIGCDLRVMRADPLSWPEFVLNPVDRCYLCKKKIYSIFQNALADSDQILMDGSNLDDLGDDRPGRKAVSELGVQTPLIEAKLGKASIRQLCRELSLPNWNKVSASCLATRLPAGMSITGEKLTNVAMYESVMHDLGFYGCRVKLLRSSDHEVKVEVAKEDLQKISDVSMRERVLAGFFRCGISKVSLDLTGR